MNSKWIFGHLYLMDIKRDKDRQNHEEWILMIKCLFVLICHHCGKLCQVGDKCSDSTMCSQVHLWVISFKLKGCFCIRAVQRCWLTLIQTIKTRSGAWTFEVFVLASVGGVSFVKPLLITSSHHCMWDGATLSSSYYPELCESLAWFENGVGQGVQIQCIWVCWRERYC